MRDVTVWWLHQWYWICLFAGPWSCKSNQTTHKYSIGQVPWRLWGQLQRVFFRSEELATSIIIFSNMHFVGGGGGVKSRAQSPVSPLNWSYSFIKCKKSFLLKNWLGQKALVKMLHHWCIHVVSKNCMWQICLSVVTIPKLGKARAHVLNEMRNPKSFPICMILLTGCILLLGWNNVVLFPFIH